MKKYHVEVFEYKNGRKKVDQRFGIIAWTRFEAYVSVKNELKSHVTWDATVEKDI